MPKTEKFRSKLLDAVKALPKQAKDMGEVQNIVNEMMPLLPPGMPKPGIKLVNQMRSHWLGRTSWGYRERSGVAEWDATTEILIQRRVLGHDETLRRVIAHELCHHWDIMANDVADLKKMGVRTFMIYQRAQSKHGANWKEFASIFNAKYGQGFVTEKSNKDYVEDMSSIPEYFLLLQQMPNGHIHYQVAMRLGPKQQKWVNAHAGHPEYRLLKSKEPEFFRGPAIASGRWAYAREADAQRKEKLQSLWDSAQTKTSADQAGAGAAAKVAALEPSEQQRMESLFSKTALPSFILPTGEKIDTTEDSHLGHTRYIYGDPDNDRLDEFLKTTGAVRVIYPEFTGEEHMGVEMFKMPTPVQVREIASALKTFGGRYLWWDIRPLKAHGKGTIGEFQRALAGAKQAKDGRQPVVKSADADKPPRKNASTQINITGEAAYRMKQAADKFPKDELAGDGIEGHPHITVKFGVQEDEEALARVAREFEPFDITFGKLHAFEPSESSDGAAPVVVLMESPELLKLNAAVKAAISNREDDFEYEPHATLAYVRPDMAHKYEGSAVFEGMEFRVGAITLSRKDRTQVDIPLGSGKAVMAAVRNREHSLTMTAEIEGFPPVVVIRWPQKSMRWRTVLTIVKQIAGDVAGRRVPWRAIHVFESPWGSKLEQDEQWEDWSAKKKFPMYDILGDGTFVSVGKLLTHPHKRAAAEIDFPTFDEVIGPDPDNEFILADDYYGPDESDYEAALKFWLRQNFPLTIYRVLALKAGDKPRFADVGLSWSLNKDAAMEAVTEMFPDRENYHVFEGQVTADAIDWLTTFRAWLTLPDEREVRLKPGSKIQSAGRTITAATVYRGETPGGQPAGFAATFVSENPDSAAQYGEVKRLALDPDAKFLDIDSPDAHGLVEEFRGEKLSKEDFDDLAPGHFMFPDEAWREFLTGKGYNGTRIGKDLAVFDAGMLKAGSHKETPLEDTVYPHFEMDDAGQETQAYANLPDRVDGATVVPSLKELVPQEFEKIGAVSGSQAIPTLEEFIQQSGGIEQLYQAYDADDKTESAFYRTLKQKYARFMRELQKFPLILYREVALGSLDNLKAGIGTSWTSIPIEEGTFWNQPVEQGTPFIFKAEAGRDDIDWHATMWNRFYPSLGEQEKEITLKHGVQIKIIGVKEATDKGWQPYGKNVIAAYAEAQNQVQHTRHDNVSISKTPKDSPFAEEELAQGKEAGLSNLGEMGLRVVESAAKGRIVGEAYLLHFDIPAGASIAPSREDASKDFHARHYMGWAENAQARIKEHYNGTSGVKIIDAIHKKNITFTVARVWEGLTRKDERRLKDQGGLSRHCPICKQQGLIPASRYRGKALEAVQVAPESSESGPDFFET